MPTTRTINAEHLKLALRARRLRARGPRWAAMSNGMATPACKPQTPDQGWGIHFEPRLSPLLRGQMDMLLRRTCLRHGATEALRTWGMGPHSLAQEFARPTIEAGQ